MKHHYQIFGSEPVKVVIEMGLGSCADEWFPIANQLGTHVGVLVYERAGINQSEKSENSRTPKNIAMELYDLLETIPHANQIVLLAHSQGGLYAQTFCRIYPQLVSGIILLDPLAASDIKFAKQLSKEEYHQSGVDKSSSFQIMYRLAKMKLGFITKTIMKTAPPFYYYNDFSEEERKNILGSFTKPIHLITSLNEYKEAHKEENLVGLNTKEGFPDIPLILITHSSEMAVKESMKFGHNTSEFAQKIECMWQDIMKEYLLFTFKSRWIQAQKSTHYIHLMEADLVIEQAHKLK